MFDNFYEDGGVFLWRHSFNFILFLLLFLFFFFITSLWEKTKNSGMTISYNKNLKWLDLRTYIPCNTSRISYIYVSKSYGICCSVIFGVICAYLLLRAIAVLEIKINEVLNICTTSSILIIISKFQPEFRIYIIKSYLQRNKFHSNGNNFLFN